MQMTNYVSHSGVGNVDKQSLPVHCSDGDCVVHLESLSGSVLLCFPWVARLISCSILLYCFVPWVCVCSSLRGKAGEFIVLNVGNLLCRPPPIRVYLFYFFSFCIYSAILDLLWKPSSFISWQFGRRIITRKDKVIKVKTALFVSWVPDVT